MKIIRTHTKEPNVSKKEGDAQGVHVESKVIN